MEVVKSISFTYKDGESDEHYYGMTANESDGGVCFYSTCNIEVGNEIVINPDKTTQCIAGKIRWVKKINSISKVGVKYSKLRPV